MTIGLIANPKARAFRRDPTALERLTAHVGHDDTWHAPDTLDGLDAAVQQVLERGHPTLAVAGGDGTVSRVTTALLRHGDHDQLPELAVLHAGTMNTISRSMGNRGTPEDQLLDLLQGRTTRTQRWPLQVGDDRWGYLFGVGLIPRYIHAYESGGEPSPLKAATTLLRATASAFVGGAFARAFFKPVVCTVHCDDRPWPHEAWLLLTAGAIDDTGLRFRPFPGVLDHPGHMHVFGSASSPAGFAWDLLPLRLARPARHPKAVDQVCRVLRIQADGPILYNLDGDLDEAPERLTVRSGPAVVFRLAHRAVPPRNRLGP